MINKVILLGRLGRDPETRSFPDGASYCIFPLATSKKWKDRNGQAQERTEWHRIITFAPFAEHCTRYLHKGSLVYVEGEIKARRWKDKEGREQSITEIISSVIKFLDGTKEPREQTAMQNNQYQQGSFPTLPTKQDDEQMTMISSVDEIPF